MEEIEDPKIWVACLKKQLPWYHPSIFLPLDKEDSKPKERQQPRKPKNKTSNSATPSATTQGTKILRKSPPTHTGTQPRII